MIKNNCQCFFWSCSVWTRFSSSRLICVWFCSATSFSVMISDRVLAYLNHTPYQLLQVLPIVVLVLQRTFLQFGVVHREPDVLVVRELQTTLHTQSYLRSVASKFEIYYFSRQTSDSLSAPSSACIECDGLAK